MRLWKLIASLAVVGVLASAAFASAAMLNLNSQGVQAGGTVIRGCQGDVPVSVSYETGYSDFLLAFAINAVTVSGIAPSCVTTPPTHTMRVVLTRTGFPPLDCGTLPITAASLTFTSIGCTPTPASLVTDVHIVIN